MRTQCLQCGIDPLDADNEQGRITISGFVSSLRRR